MNIKDVSILSVLLVVLSLTGISQVRYSILDGGGFPGGWNDGNYWSISSGGVACSCIPSSSDVVFIEEDMDLNDSFSVGDYLRIDASKTLSTLVNNLDVKTNATLEVYGTLEVYDLEFANNSIIHVYSGGQIIVHGDLTNKNNSDNVTINGSVTVAGEFSNGNGGVVVGTGEITAGTFTGSGTTFGVENGTIAPGSKVSEVSLPIELLSFTAKAVGNSKVELSWSTSAEINNDFFTIERSNDGVVFEEIEYIEAAGNSNSIINYTHIDYNPNNGVNYYRLKQTDFNGDFEYFNIEAVSLNVEKEKTISIYPNPVNHNNLMSYSIDGLLNNQDVDIIVSDVLGRIVFTERLLSDENGSVKGYININSDIPTGNYILIYSSNGEVNRSKFVVN